MVETTKPNAQLKQKAQEEQILVVPRKEIFAGQEAWTGMKKVDPDTYLELIKTHQQFHPRSVMETDPAYKQIIPYLVFAHKDKYFLMQRSANASEQRLKNKYSLGIGGHIRKEDMTTNALVDWAQREFHEEVRYVDSFNIKPLGLLNDDSNDVGKVHIGFVFLVEGATPDISIKSELKTGKLLSLQELKLYFTYMETWSQMLFEFLMREQS